jgi:hypothetical protein
MAHANLAEKSRVTDWEALCLQGCRGGAVGFSSAGACSRAAGLAELVCAVADGRLKLVQARAARRLLFRSSDPRQLGHQLPATAIATVHNKSNNKKHTEPRNREQELKNKMVLRSHDNRLNRVPIARELETRESSVCKQQATERTSALQEVRSCAHALGALQRGERRLPFLCALHLMRACHPGGVGLRLKRRARIAALAGQHR